MQKKSAGWKDHAKLLKSWQIRLLKRDFIPHVIKLQMFLGW